MRNFLLTLHSIYENNEKHLYKYMHFYIQKQCIYCLGVILSFLKKNVYFKSVLGYHNEILYPLLMNIYTHIYIVSQ